MLARNLTAFMPPRMLDYVFDAESWRAGWSQHSDLGATVARAVWDGPCPSAKIALRRARLLAKCALQFQSLREWHDRPQTPDARELLARHPLMPVEKRRPYLNSRWSLEKRMSVVEGHYAAIARSGMRALRLASQDTVVLATLDDIQPGLKIVLDSPDWFVNEGELTINLFDNDVRAYTLAFSIGEENGRMVAYIGAIQGGASNTNALERNKALTKAAHGMRPRDLVFSSFRAFCRALGVETIKAVSTRACSVRSGYYDNFSCGHFDYDTAWVEYGGVENGEHMFDISPVSPPRDLAQVESRKRSMYRRRFAMLDTLDAAIEARVRQAGSMNGG
jgi:uncharacterized protein